MEKKAEVSLLWTSRCAPGSGSLLDIVVEVDVRTRQLVKLGIVPHRGELNPKSRSSFFEVRLYLNRV